MKKVFPSMFSEPEKGQIITIIPCWLFFFVLLPMYMPFIGFGLWEQVELSVWLEIGYHVITGITMFFVIFSYLKDEWFMVTTNVRYYLKHVALTIGLIIAAEFALLITLHLLDCNYSYLFEFLPVTEMSISHTPYLVLDLQPIFGTIVFSIFVPFSVCALFYCLIFAPICNRKPWLAYLCVAVITLIPSVIDILWRGNEGYALSNYIVKLPVHLLACWSYQKTDNVWTPIATVAVTNLLASILIPVFMSL